MHRREYRNGFYLPISALKTEGEQKINEVSFSGELSL